MKNQTFSQRFWLVLILGVVCAWGSASAQSGPVIEVSAAQGVRINGKVLTPGPWAEGLAKRLSDEPKFFELRGTFIEFNKSGIIIPRYGRAIQFVLPFNDMGLDRRTPISFTGTVAIEGVILKNMERSSVDDVLKLLTAKGMNPQKCDADPEFSHQLTVGKAIVIFTRGKERQMARVWIQWDDSEPDPKEFLK
ncbi:hypothetical protein DES53_110119 [Roseimicrobium gellanilyticum]|uniref:Uncharacterized protein n=1 Tax=Roseimicrobium gellanilyticum TaxID=748857 RepID=A0A366HA59_9BACT|nr:hypothetical protein [Roseimicrobium gellanilyticum]RBP39095.1 hypothetical protein DES53_110119 [Roseimicrobium gellanilyticum]